jgi:outer membrane protein
MARSLEKIDMHHHALTQMIWSVMFLAGVALAGCAGFYTSEAPRIETYLPQAAMRSNEASQKLPPADRREKPVTSGVEEAPLTLDAALRIALDKNPLNRAAQEGIVAAREATGEARAPFYPDLNLNAGYSRWKRHAFLPEGVVRADQPSIIGPTDDWSAALRARYTLFDSGQRRAELRAALAKEGAAAEEAARIRQDIALDVHKAFFGHVAALETQAVAEKNLARSENHLRLARERKAASVVPQADVVRAQVEVADARLALVRADNLVRVSRGDLNTAMGLPVDVAVVVDAQGREITSPEAIELPTALERASRERPELRATLQRIAIARSSVDIARSAVGPKFRAEGAYGWRDENFLPGNQDYSAGFSLEVPLFSGFARLHRLARTRAELLPEEAGTESLTLKVQQEVWSAYSKLHETFQAVQTA